jgi:hypothetical protein
VALVSQPAVDSINRLILLGANNPEIGEQAFWATTTKLMSRSLSVAFYKSLISLVKKLIPLAVAIGDAERVEITQP